MFAFKMTISMKTEIKEMRLLCNVYVYTYSLLHETIKIENFLFKTIKIHVTKQILIGTSNLIMNIFTAKK